MLETLDHLRRVHRQLLAHHRVVRLGADDPRHDVAGEVAAGPEVEVADRQRDQPVVGDRRAEGEELVPRRRRGEPELVEEVDVVPDDVGDVGVAGDHHDLVVDGHAVEGALVEQLAELGVGDGAGEVEGEALLDALLEAGAGPLEVDVGRVATAQQVGQADRLVEVVVLEVELDGDARVGLLEGGAGGLPHGDLRLARRAHRHAQRELLVGTGAGVPAGAAGEPCGEDDRGDEPAGSPLACRDGHGCSPSECCCKARSIAISSSEPNTTCGRLPSSSASLRSSALPHGVGEGGAPPRHRWRTSPATAAARRPAAGCGRPATAASPRHGRAGRPSRRDAPGPPRLVAVGEIELEALELAVELDRVRLGQAAAADGVGEALQRPRVRAADLGDGALPAALGVVGRPDPRGSRRSSPGRSSTPRRAPSRWPSRRR